MKGHPCASRDCASSLSLTSNLARREIVRVEGELQAEAVILHELINIQESLDAIQRENT